MQIPHFSCWEEEENILTIEGFDAGAQTNNHYLWF